MNRWRGRVALVTGASSGIGRAIAIRLLNHGLNVVACARRVDAVEAIKDEVAKSGDGVGELLAVKCDVSKEEEILAMFERIKASKLGGVDVCVNNAGVARMEKVWEGATTGWKNMLDVNVLGLSICTREAVKSMRERGVDDGCIIQISSDSAHDFFPDWTFYGATKWAVRSFTEGLRQELLAEKSSIRVSEICPGFVKTEAFGLALPSGQAGAEQLFATEPYMLPDDIADAVAYVLSAPKYVQVQNMILTAVRSPEDGEAGAPRLSQ